jgi:hypothetical protein
MLLALNAKTTGLMWLENSGVADPDVSFHELSGYSGMPAESISTEDYVSGTNRVDILTNAMTDCICGCRHTNFILDFSKLLLQHPTQKGDQITHPTAPLADANSNHHLHSINLTRNPTDP